MLEMVKTQPHNACQFLSYVHVEGSECLSCPALKTFLSKLTKYRRYSFYVFGFTHDIEKLTVIPGFHNLQTP